MFIVKKSSVPITRPARSAAHDTPGFNPAINGFRGVCVLLVFAFHVVNAGLLPELNSALVFVTSSWRYGVELFFMISGYVIVNSLRRHRHVGDFLRDRCLRIFPVWIPVHLLVFCVGAVVGWKMFSGLGLGQMALVFVSNLLLLPPLLPLPVLHPASWSLTYELLFYLLAAAAFALHVRQIRNVQLHTALWLLWVVTTLTLLALLPRALFFVPGVMLALGVIPLHRWRALWRLPWLSLIVFLLAWRMVNLDQAHPGAYSLAAMFAGAKPVYVLVALLSGLHLFACLCAQTTSVRWLQRGPMQWLGTVSYSFYLWHPIVMFVVKKAVLLWVVPMAGATFSTLIFALVSLAVALPVSWWSYQWLERGLAGALRQAWARQRAQRSAAPEPAAISVRIEGG